VEADWYFRLFFVNISWFVISWLLFGIIRAKRMTGPGPSRPWVMAFQRFTPISLKTIDNAFTEAGN